MAKVIHIENLSKQYQLGLIGAQTLREEFSRWWARLRNQPDPAIEVQTSDSDNAKYIWALRDVNLEVQEGEALGIVGRNGAGKSTLLKILSRITAPTSGVVKVKGRIASLLEVGTGFHPELTGYENIFLSGAILGMRKAEIRKRLDQIVDFSGIARFLHTPVKRYSSGMYVRLAFAVAAHLESEILIVDEILAVGDVEFQKKCLGKMDAAATQGRTVLFVSHNMAALQRLCTRGILLEQGRIVAGGDIQSVTDRYLNSLGETATYWERTSVAASDIFFNRVFVANGNQEPIQHVTTATGVSVVMDFTIRARARDPLLMGITVYDAERNSLFSSVPPDAGVEIAQEPGTYRYVARLPDQIFMPRKYTIKAVLWSAVTGTFDSVDAITFTVHETASLLNATPGGRTGSLLVLCDWKKEQQV